MSKLPRYIVTHKPIGKTPLEVIQEIKRNDPTYAAVPMSFAGRLDPLASGKLIILVGEECKKAKDYLGLDKEYEFEVLLGIATDTYDVLGMPNINAVLLSQKPDTKLVERITKKFLGQQTFAYPPFSSKTVDGKPLLQHALEGGLDAIEIPTKDVVIHKLSLNNIREIKAGELFTQIRENIESIAPVTEDSKALGNDFRRPVIRELYKTIEQGVSQDQTFYILKFTCICSSGTYMRTLADMIGKELAERGLAFSINRTQIGKYIPVGPSGFWIKKF